jgi:hypothetical protein
MIQIRTGNWINPLQVAYVSAVAGPIGDYKVSIFLAGDHEPVTVFCKTMEEAQEYRDSLAKEIWDWFLNPPARTEEW